MAWSPWLHKAYAAYEHDEKRRHARLAGGLESLFANGENGFLFDNMSDTTRLFTTSTGPTNIAANDDPVGLILGNSKWAGKTLAQVLAEQPEKIVNGGFDADASWTKTQATISGGVGTVNSPDGSAASLRQDQTGLVVGATYRIQFEVTAISAGFVAVDFSGSSYTPLNSTTPGTKTFYAVATASTFFAIKRGNTGAANLFTIDNVSIKEVPGNHALQATANSRPLWKANSGKPYLNFDGTDDRIVTPYIPGAAGTVAALFRMSTQGYAVGGGTPTGNKRCRLGLNGSGFPECSYNDQFTAFSALGDKRNTDVLLVQTWDATTRECWVDGVQLLSEARVSNLDGTGSGFALGSIESASNFMNGRLYASLARSTRSTPSEIARITSIFQQSL